MLRKQLQFSLFCADFGSVLPKFSLWMPRFRPILWRSTKTIQYGYCSAQLCPTQLVVQPRIMSLSQPGPHIE